MHCNIILSIKAPSIQFVLRCSRYMLCIFSLYSYDKFTFVSSFSSTSSFSNSLCQYPSIYPRAFRENLWLIIINTLLTLSLTSLSKSTVERFIVIGWRQYYHFDAPHEYLIPSPTSSQWNLGVNNTETKFGIFSDISSHNCSRSIF